jgi:hypothetical protein
VPCRIWHVLPFRAGPLGSHPSPKAQPAILSDVAGDEGLLIDPKMRFDGLIFRFRQIFFQIFFGQTRWV